MKNWTQVRMSRSIFLKKWSFSERKWEKIELTQGTKKTGAWGAQTKNSCKVYVKYSRKKISHQVLRRTKNCHVFPGTLSFFQKKKKKKKNAIKCANMLKVGQIAHITIPLRLSVQEMKKCDIVLRLAPIVVKLHKWKWFSHHTN